MTRPNLEEIHKRHAATTPGEWRPGKDYDYGVYAFDGQGNSDQLLTEGQRATFLRLEDAVFCTHAHNTDIPALLAYVEEQAEEIDKLRRVNKSACEAYLEKNGENKKLLDELKKS